MKPCTHRRPVGCLSQEFLCSHPRVISQGNRVSRSVCEVCRRCDNGIQTAEPLRIGNERRGMGDLVADALAWLGFKQRKTCGCTKRQRLLNKLLPFRRREVVEVVESGASQ